MRKRWLSIIFLFVFTLILCLSGCKENVKYKVDFMVDDELYASITIEQGKEAQLPTSPTKEGYNFSGWFIDKDEWKDVFNDESLNISSMTNDLVVYAKFDILNYNAKFVAEGKEIGNVLFSINDTTLNAIPDVPIKEGYEGIWEEYTLNKSDIQVNAIYTPITYTITYSNTMDVTNSNQTSYTIENETFALNNLECDGYIFDGWYINDEKVTEIKKGTIGDISLTAKWNLVNYNARFIAEGKEIGNVLFNINDTTLNAIPDVPIKEGYEGIWEEYTLNKNDIQVNAIYTPITYTINYLDTKEVSNSNPINYTIESDTIILSDLTLDGYEFLGWYIDDDKVTEIKKGTIGDISLTAKWDEFYTISFDIGDGTTESTIKSIVVKSFNPKDFVYDLTKADYKFRGWSYNDVQVIDEDGNVISTPKMEKNMTFTAIYRQDVKVTVKVEEGQEEMGIVYIEGYDENVKSVYIPYNTIPTLIGRANDQYVVNNWGRYCASQSIDIYTDENRPSDWYLNTSTEDVVLVCRFEKKMYGLEIVSYDKSVGYICISPSETTTPDSPGSRHYQANMTGGTYWDNEVLVGSWNLNEEISFLGWFDENDNLLSTESKYTFIMPKHDVKLIAKWDYFTASYNLDDGIVDGTNPTTVKYGEEYELISPTKTGYEFVGWYLDSEYQNKVEKIEKGTCKNITLYAKFEIINYIISYQLFDGTNSVDNPETYNMLSDTITLATPTKYGYEFLKWISIDTGEEIKTIEKGSKGNISLMASWKLIVYNITYNLNDSNINKFKANNENNPLTYNSFTETITLKDPIREGYTFDGWYSDKDFTTKIYEIAKGTDSDVTIYAKWNAITYKVSYILNGGTNNESNPEYVNVNNYTYLKSPTKTGYKFNGWLLVTFKEDGTYELANTYYIGFAYAHDSTWYAVWTPISYSITYNLNGGTNDSSNPKSYTIESDSFSYKPATRVGYDFVCWAIGSVSSTATEYTSTNGVTKGSIGNITVSAIYTPKYYKVNAVSSDSSKGSTAVEGTLCTDGTVTVRATPKTGYKLKGWYNGDTFLTMREELTFTMEAHDYTFKAIFWTEAEQTNRLKALGQIPTYAKDDDDYEYVSYGLYPQTKVTDESLISKLNDLSPTYDFGWYYIDDVYYAKNGSDYFKCEPIIWGIISNTDNTYELLTYKLIDYRCWNSGGLTKYCNSEIRTWLNGEFYNKAFFLNNSPIQITSVDNSADTCYYNWIEEGGYNKNLVSDPTEDKIYMLSAKDETNSIGTIPYAWSSGYLIATPTYTDYVASLGAKNTKYWTRSPYCALNDQKPVCAIINESGINPGTYEIHGGIAEFNYCVRPCMRIVIS